VGGVTNFTTATSTFYFSGGLNLAGGCFAVNGTCVSGGSGSSGAMTLVSTQTANNSSSLQWTNLSGYDYYQLTCKGLAAAVGTPLPLLQFGTGNTPTWITSNYKSGVGGCTDVSDEGGDISCADGLISGNYGMVVQGTIGVPSGSSNFVTSGTETQKNRYTEVWGGGYNGSFTTLSAIRLVMSDGSNIASGQCSLYGMSS
jgi:hypothetical protein